MNWKNRSIPAQAIKLWRFAASTRTPGKFGWLTLIFIPLFISSCTITSGNRVTLTQSDLARIQKLGLLVKQEEGFSVRFSRDKMTGTGAIFGGLAGLAIEGGARASADAKLTGKLKPVLSDYDARTSMEEVLRAELELAHLFAGVEISAATNAMALKSRNLDASLLIILKRWGLSPCPDAPKDRLQTHFSIDLRMIDARNPKPLWERSDVYLDGHCHTLDEYQNQPGLLKSGLDQAVHDLSRRIINEIRFPQ